MDQNLRLPIIDYLHFKGRKQGLPISGSFELTARCNFKCPMCYVHLTQEQVNARGEELSAAQWLQIAQQARDSGMVFALLTGGEPLLRKDFFEIYRGMKRMGLMISINTNGSLLSGEILEQFKQEPPMRFNISLYGGCRDTYRSMCGKDMFEQVVNNIRALREADINVSVNLSITPYNCGDLEEIHRITREMNVPVKVANYMYPPVRVNGVYGCANRLSPEDSAEAMVRWYSLRDSKETFFARAERLKAMQPVEEQECILELGSEMNCRAGRTGFWMTWDGKMTPCGMFTEPAAYPLKTGFAEAWESVRSQTRSIRTPAKCVSCSKRKICHVCAAVCVTETGAFDQVPEYLCRQTDATIEKMWQAYQERKGEKHAD